MFSLEYLYAIQSSHRYEKLSWVVMLWECRSARRSEKFPHSVPRWPAGWESNGPAKELLPIQVNAKSLNAGPVVFWLKLVKRYSKLSATSWLPWLV